MRAFSLAEESFAPYSSRGGCELREAERAEQSKELTDTMVDGVAVVGVAGLLAWFQGKSGGTMPKLVGVPYDALAGLLLVGTGLYMQYTETGEEHAIEHIMSRSVDWGRALTMGGFGAFAWFVGNWAHDKGKASFDAAQAGTPAAPAVTSPGWAPQFGQGFRAQHPGFAQQNQYAGAYMPRAA